MQRLTRHLQRAERLRPGLNQRRALALMMLLTSYDSFRELREAGLSEREITTNLQQTARALLLSEREPAGPVAGPQPATDVVHTVNPSA
jgi:hypothetical protein